MTNILLGLVALGVVLWGMQVFARANPQHVARWLRQGAGVVTLAFALFALARGSASFAFPLALVAIWLLSSQGGFSWPSAGGGSPSAGKTSAVKTEHLEMELDHVSGDMRGRVLKGFFAGRRLDSLRPVELAHLWQDCRFADPQSAQLVEAYLDRVHPTWRDDMAREEAGQPRGPDGKMTPEEALEILGLAAGASVDEIRQAHRALMLKMHPDKGGSTYLAAKINEAKDVLLAGRG